jgi:hypothetical protein
MESAHILQAVEQYRKELAAVAIANPATRYFPTHDDEAVQRIREFQQIGAQLWSTRTDGHA